MSSDEDDYRTMSNNVYRAVCDDRADDLAALLYGVEADQRRKLLTDAFQRTTALDVASHYGYEDVVRLILAVMKPLQSGDDDTLSNALWNASNTGPLSMVRALVEEGYGGTVTNAQVNAKALRWAIEGQRHDIIAYHLEGGADPNLADSNGNTALHKAAIRSPLKLIKDMVVRYGASATVAANRLGDTPLSLAIHRGQLKVVEFLMMPEMSLGERVETLELTAVYCPITPNNGHEAHAIYAKAMDLRWSEEPVVPKKLSRAPIAEYENRVEAQTPADVLALKNNPTAMCYEFLLVAERILGLDTPKFCEVLERTARLFDDDHHPVRSLQLFLRLPRAEKKSQSAFWAICRMAKILEGLSDADSSLNLLLLQTLDFTRGELVWIKVQQFQNNHEHEITIDIFMRLLHILVKRVLPKPTKEQEVEAAKIIGEVMKRLDPRTGTGASLLHLALMPPGHTYYGTRICHRAAFLLGQSPIAVAKLLLDAGADPNAADDRGKTPLHILAAFQCLGEISVDEDDSYTAADVDRVDHDDPVKAARAVRRVESDKAVLAFAELFTAKSHVDAVDKNGFTALQLAQRSTGADGVTPSAMANILGKWLPPLKCLAARSIKASGQTPQEEDLPPGLFSFLNLHR